jgi:signal transduction histidine kinase
MASPQRPRPPDRKRADRDAKLARLSVLYRISDILATTHRGDTVLRRILREAVAATRATSGSLVLIDRATGILNIEIAHNLDPKWPKQLKLRIGQGVTGWVALTGEPLLVGDVRRSPHYIKIKTEIKSELAVPLIIGGEVVGVINVDSNKRDAFTAGDQELLVAIAAQSARVMQAANLYEENRLKAERLATLFKVSSAIVSEPLLEDVLRRIADEVRQLMDVRVCSIMLLDEKEENLEIKAVSGEVAPAYINRRGIPVGDNVIGRVIHTGRPLFVADVREEPQYRMRKVAKDSGLCSLLSIPMVFLGRTIGVLNIYTGRPLEFSEEDVALMTTFAGHAAVAIVNARRYERIFRTEELLRQSEKFQLLGMLSAEIAHEVKNPLTIINMLVHTMENDPSVSEQTRYDLGVMNRKLGHINKIVDQVLDFSRSRQPEPVSVDLNAVIEDVSILIGYKAAEMGLQLVRQVGRDLPPVQADAGQIEQAVLNLALNGLEAMREGGKRLTLATSRVGRKGGDWVRIRVRDEGRGIPEETLSRIFTPFFSMREQGTGLGLFITHRIIKQYGGELKVRSTLGEGSTFDVLLPASAGSSAASAPLSPHAAPA